MQFSLSSKSISSKYLLTGILTFICIFINISLVSTLTLDDDGGYHIVVALDKHTAQNSMEYIHHTRTGFQMLSDFLHHSTQQKFYIKRVDLVVPEHWYPPPSLPIGTAATQSFEKADVRISHEYHEPNVYNPILCGSPGEYIKLPYDFFNEQGIGGHYGRVGPTLLTLWARFRFGVWDEHGFPVDPAFPYFYKWPGEDGWIVNSCSDVPLTGEIKTVDGRDCDRENPEENPPSYDCRFYPNVDQQPQPKSSIMSFYRLTSIERFCDKDTHDKRAPNRQNILCQYKSVQEIMELSPDWKSVTANNTPGAITFNILKPTKLPLLHLVLDGGITSTPASVITEIKNNLKALFNESDPLVPAGLLVRVGSFSTLKDGKVYTLNEELPWSVVDNTNTTREAIDRAIDASFTKSRGFRDFGRAIKEAVDNIVLRKHEHNGIVVIVKTGNATDFDKIGGEDEIIAAVKEAGIKIFTFEVRGTNLQPGINLKTFTEEVGGSHIQINNMDDLELMKTRLGDVVEAIKVFPQPLKQFRVLYKGAITSPKNIPLDIAQVSKLHFRMLTTSSGLNNLIVEQESQARVTITEKPEWQNLLGVMRAVYKGDFTYSAEEELEVDTWKFSFGCVSGFGCKMFLIIYAEMKDIESSEKYPSDDIKIFVTTTAVSGKVDMALPSTRNLANTPFAIYAKVEHEGFPVKNIAESISVQATIRSNDYKSYWTIDLVDSGIGGPDADTDTNDGIFSGTFVPDVNGIFHIFVTVHFRYRRKPEDTTTEATVETNADFVEEKSARLITVDQGMIGCGSDFSGCWATELEIDFDKVVDYDRSVEFINKENFRPLYNRIMDLKVTPLDAMSVRLTWSTPGKLEITSCGGRGEYTIGYMENFETLVESFEKATPIHLDDNEVGSYPGLVVNRIHPVSYETVQYFAILASYACDLEIGYLPNEPSTVAGVETFETVPTTIAAPTPPTTTTTTTTTTTMAPPITEPPKSSTTTRPTTPSVTRSTTQSSTTTTISTTSGPTRSTTTEKAESIKRWYQEPEGYTTLSVFGGAILLLAFVGFFIIWRKYRQALMRKSQSDMHLTLAF